MKHGLIVLGLILQGVLSPLASGETTSIAPRKYALGVRAEGNSQLVFVRCALDTCEDISNPWQVAIFRQELQAGLAAAKMNALFKAGIFAGLGAGSAWTTFKIYRSFDELGLLSSDARATIAGQSEFYRAIDGPITRSLENGLMAVSVVADIARIFSLPAFGAATLACLGGAGDEIWQALTQPDPAKLQEFLFDRIHQHRVYLFTDETEDAAVVKSQEADLQQLFDRIVTDFGA